MSAHSSRGLYAFLLGALASLMACAASAEESSAPPTGAWEFLQSRYYGAREIVIADDSFMNLVAPGTTPDAAATPVTLRFGPDAIGRIKQVRVIIDNNPSPVVATFDFSESARIAELGLRVRIDRFTSVRAIAETTRGELQMRSSWVNASGGCSAPPSAAAGGVLGEVRFRPSEDASAIQIGIRHPNHSGFQIDPKTGEPIPAHFVSQVRISSGGRPLIDAATGISLSENPTLRIASNAPLPALHVDIVDSKEARFAADWSAVRSVADRGDKSGDASFAHP